MLPEKILFCHNYPTQFVTGDLALLRERYQVREWYQRTRVIQLAALAAAVRECDLVVGWFASWHTFFPIWYANRLGRRSLLFVGGYDTAPRLDSGYQRSAFKQWLSRTTLRHAAQLVAPSRFVQAELASLPGIVPARVTTIYHGLDAPPLPGALHKEAIVLTVGNVDRANLVRKGLEPFVHAAAQLPNVPFVLVGRWRDRSIDQLRAVAGANVTFTGWVAATCLGEFFARAQVYVQASRHEGFGLAVAEAMLYECIPVVTRAGALPEVVGEAGVYMDSAETVAVAAAIRIALAAGMDAGHCARERIVREFPRARRREALYRLIDAL